MIKLQQAASTQILSLSAFFDEAFALRPMDRFSTVQVMREKMKKITQNNPAISSVDEGLAAIREVLDSTVNRRLMVRISQLREMLTMVRQVFDQLQQSIGSNLSISHTNFEVGGEIGRSSTSWSRLGSNDRLISVTYEVVPAGDELLLRMSGETLFRTDIAEPRYGSDFEDVIKPWLVTRLLAVLSDPNSLPHEADKFRETRPFGSLEEAALEARQTNRSILAFVYDPVEPERGQLGWALGYFLKNKRTRDMMNGTFVTALVPLSAIAAVSDILEGQSMEECRWVVLDQQLSSLEQQVIYANPQEAERIIEEIAKRYRVEMGSSE